VSRETDVQSIVRVLSVIEVLNQRSVTSIDAMHKVTGIPKPTLVRLLGTLVGAGYVFHVSRRDGYALTEKVLRLSAGYQYQDAVVDIARPLLEAFTRRHKWQISFATPDNDAMRVRFNTRHLSPFAPDNRRLNHRVGMLTSAMGRAYIAFCSNLEREIIMSFLLASDEDMNARAKEPGYVEVLIERARAKGYATIRRAAANHTRSIAIPVLSAGTETALASMAIFYFSSTMSEAQAAAKFLDEMYDIAGQITSALTRVHEAEPGAVSARRA
jgi:IclR family mhp operon transcriptional activator